MRIPKYYRLKGGSSQFVVDPFRKATLFDGGAYDTYVTYDKGNSWESVFDLKMFFIDVNTKWKMDERGNWYYAGRVYNTLDINLVTEDAGKTIRYLVQDTNDVPGYGRYDRVTVDIGGPDAVYLNFGGRARETARRGIYSTCDVGRTWQYIPTGISDQFSPTDVISIAPNLIGLGVGTPTYVEHELCNSSAAGDTTSVRTGAPYVRLKDGTALMFSWQYRLDTFRVQRAGVADEEVYTMYPDAETGVRRPLFVKGYGALNDSTILILAQDGVVATYTKTDGLNFIHVPPYRSPYQQVGDVGAFGDLVIVRSVSHVASIDSIARWTVLNTKTGASRTHIRPASAFMSRTLSWEYPNILEDMRIIPYSDSVWMASLDAGEVMRTTNAGETWTMVENMPRDVRWGEPYIGVNRLFPRGNGTMGVVTEAGRLMVQGSGTTQWHIAHLGPFSHFIDNTGFWYPGTNNVFMWAEDIRGRLRSRYGPSSVYFNTPDTMWLSGDAVTSWTTDGKYIDTVLPRKARVLKRISETMMVAAMDSVWLSRTDNEEWVYISEHWPKWIYGKDTVKAALGDMVVAGNGDLVAGLRGLQQLDTLGAVFDSVPGGILYSADSGLTWSPGSIGVPNHLYVTSLLKLPSNTLLCMGANVVVDPRVPHVPYFFRIPAGSCDVGYFKLGQVYIYRSLDNGRTWTESFIFPSRDTLPPTDPRLLMMSDGRVMAVHPSAGLAISATDGRSFGMADPQMSFLPSINDVVFTDDGWVHFATDSGYVRVRISNILDVKEETRNIGSLRAHVSAADVLSITCDIVPTSIRLIALDGTTVRSTVEPLTHSLALDVSALAAGTYVVVAANTNEVRSALIQLP